MYQYIFLQYSKKKLKFFFEFRNVIITMATITKQLEQNALIEQIVFMMSTKFKLDNREASAFVFDKLSEETAIVAAESTKEPKAAAKRTKKVAANANAEVIPVEAPAEVVVEAVNEQPKAVAKRTKKVAANADAPVEVVVEAVNEQPKAAAKRTKKVAANANAEVIPIESPVEVVVEAVKDQRKAAAKRTKKVTGLEEATSGDENVKEIKAAAKRTKKVTGLEEVTGGDENVKETKAAAKRTKKVETVNNTSDESSGDENKKGVKSSKKNKKAEILKPLELAQITDAELQEDDIEDN